MVASITTNISVALPDIPTASQQAEAAPTPAQESAATSPAKAAPAPQKAQDTVALSSTSLAMSKALNDQQNLSNPAATVTSELTQAQQPASQESKPDISTIKRYPPFMGDASQLKALKQYSPALYREILRMIVPPPIDLSYSDLQMLKGYTQDKPVS